MSDHPVTDNENKRQDVAEAADSSAATNPPSHSRKKRAIRLLPLIAVMLVGTALGAGAFTFDYGKGTSYLSSASETCANCHIMQDHYDAWVKSTHHNVTQCNDCHAPHDFIGKWYCKGRNGFFHSLAFTTQDFHEPIMINDYNRNVVEDNCRHCHSGFTHAIDVGVSGGGLEKLDCIRCHQGVGHPK